MRLDSSSVGVTSARINRKIFQNLWHYDCTEWEEDNRILCLRPGEACEEGLSLLKKKQDALEELFLLPEGDKDEDFHNIDEADLDSDDDELDRKSNV